MQWLGVRGWAVSLSDGASSPGLLDKNSAPVQASLVSARVGVVRWG
jgi:hypothetical protein